MPTLDFVTVVFKDEINMLKTQGRSINLYAHDVVDTIWVVVNDDPDVANLIDVNWWGSQANRVKVITRDALGSPDYGTGWDSQQLCKLLMAAASTQNFVVILDAKTWFIRQFNLSEMFNTDETLNVGLMPIQEVFQSGWDYLVNEFSIDDLKLQLGPAGVPYFMKTDAVRKLFEYIKEKHSISFKEWYMKYSMYPTFITEFLLYASWIYRSEGYEGIRDRQWKPVNIGRGEEHQFDYHYWIMTGPHALTVSVHRDVTLSAEQQDLWNNFLIEKNLKDVT